MKNLIFLLLILPLNAQIPPPRPGAVTRFAGHGAPGAMPTSKFGDKYIDMDANAEYTCMLAGGGCAAVSSSSWAKAVISSADLGNAAGVVLGAAGLTNANAPVSVSAAGTVKEMAAASISPSLMKASTFAVQTDNTTVTWAIASVLNAQAVLTFTVHSGSRTLNITNPVIGGNYKLKLIQDSTGGEGLLLGTGCTWLVSGGGTGAVTLTATASAVDLISFTFDGVSCLVVPALNLN